MKKRLLFSAELWESRKRLLIFFLGVNSAGKRQFGARWVCELLREKYWQSVNQDETAELYWFSKSCNGKSCVVKCQVWYRDGWICASNYFQNANARSGVVHSSSAGGMYGAKSGASSPVLQFCNTVQNKGQKKLNLANTDICVAPYVWKSWKSRCKRAGSCVNMSVVV